MNSRFKPVEGMLTPLETTARKGPEAGVDLVRGKSGQEDRRTILVLRSPSP